MKLHLFAAALIVPGMISCMQLKPRQEVDFVSEVKPLLEARCLECHQHHYVCADLNLETRELAMKGGRSGPVIVPGAPHQSLLYKVLLLGHESPVAMPPTPERLEREHAQLLHDWILQGAKWPAKVRLVPPQEWKHPPGGGRYHSGEGIDGHGDAVAIQRGVRPGGSKAVAQQGRDGHPG